MAAPNAKADKFTLSYSLWMGVPILIFDLSEQLDQLFNLYLLVIPLIAIPTLVALIAWLVGLVRNVWLRRWRRVASIMAAPVIALSFFAILSRLGIDSDRVRFELSWSYYLDQVAQIPRVGSEPRFKEFKWGDTGGAGSVNIFRRLVFDESGAVTASEYRNPDDRLSVSVRALRGHFYLVTETHQ